MQSASNISLNEGAIVKLNKDRLYEDKELGVKLVVGTIEVFVDVMSVAYV